MRKTLRKLSLLVAGLALAALLVSNLQNFEPLAVPELDNAGAALCDDPLAPVARRYAPFIYQATAARRGRQDLVSNVDFGGNLIGNNNWESFDRFRLKPTVYYPVRETETHYFIAYHLYHPRDWNHFTVWLNDTHENDGENLQVVVRKRDARVVLLWTQAHYKSWVYADGAGGITSGAVAIEAPLLRVDGEGKPGDGAHAA